MLTQLFEVLSLDAGEGSRERLASPRDVAQAAGRDSNLSGLEAFTFAYRVQFPLSLVFSTRAMLRYQTLFRFIFYLKHVERLLLSCDQLLVHCPPPQLPHTLARILLYSSVWVANKACKQLRLSAVRDGRGGWYLRALVLAQQMLHFVRSLLYYLHDEVLEPNWQSFIERDILCISASDRFAPSTAFPPPHESIIEYEYSDILYTCYCTLVTQSLLISHFERLGGLLRVGLVAGERSSCAALRGPLRRRAHSRRAHPTTTREFSRRMSSTFFTDEQRPPSQRSKAPDGLRDLFQSHEGTVHTICLLNRTCTCSK